MWMFFWGCVKQYDLTMVVEPQHAVIMTDGIPICYDSPCIQTLEKGVYTLRIQAEHFETQYLELDLRSNRKETITLVPKGGWVSILSKEPVPIAMNGALIGTAPLNRYPLSSGTHRVSVVSPCYQEWSQKIDISSGTHANLSVNPELQQIEVLVSMEESEGRKGLLVVDGVEVGWTGGHVSLPLCPQNVLVVDGERWGKKTVDWRQKKSSIELSISMEKKPKEKQSVDGLLGFIPPGCSTSTGIDEECVQLWFEKKSKESLEKNSHAHHEGCKHEREAD